MIILFFWITAYWNYLFIKESNNKAYSKWLDTAFGLIMQQAKNKNCDTVNIKNNFEEVKLINIKCLNK